MSMVKLEAWNVDGSELGEVEVIASDLIYALEKEAKKVARYGVLAPKFEEAARLVADAIYGCHICGKRGGH